MSGDPGGIDAAIKRLYDQVLNSPSHGRFIREVDQTPARDIPGTNRVTVAVVPGALYRSYPHTEADGRRFVAAARRLGFRTELVPLLEFGAVAANAKILLDWLTSYRRATGGKIILASLSKGSAEVKRALTDPAAAEAFADVVAWLNLSGVPDGSWMVNRMTRNRWSRFVTRLTCRWVRADYDVFCSLAATGAPPPWPPIPAHVKVVHVVGFPLRAHLTGRVARRNFNRLAPLGPNDGGGVLLADTLRWPGHLYPAFGADHFMRPAWDVQALVSRLLVWVMKERR
jgi:hypothetical protein